MGKIKKLPQELVSLIAAGEVVERPSSVIKELVENSIDAKATKIIVNLRDFGNDLIEVIDNGIGMNEEDVKMSVEIHATSKISSQKDLESISSLGFRGEALASIAAVAESLLIESKTAETQASLINFEGNVYNVQISSQTAQGTRIAVNGLFKHIPARRKFLKTPNTELKHIIDTFIEIALPFLNIHFELNHNGKLIHRLTKTDDIKNRVHEIWGAKDANAFYERNSPEGSLIKLDGLICKPEAATAKASIQYCYINNRFVKSTTVLGAMKQAYQGFIHRDLKPNFILFIKLDPKEVDVNVHPRKLEVKFNNEGEIFRIVLNYAKSALEAYSKKDFLSSLSNEADNTKFRVSTPISANNKAYSRISDNAGMTYGQNKVKPSNLATKSKQIHEAISFTEAILKDNGQNDEYEVPTLISFSSIIQIFNTYIVVEKDDEIIFIDQHAAAEKISFERLLNAKSSVESKPMLVPEIVEFKNSAEKRLILEKKDVLKRSGVLIEDFSEKSIQVVETPAFLHSLDLQTAIKELLTEDKDVIDTFESIGQFDSSINKEIYLTFASIACHSSIRAGQKLSDNEMRQILQDLFKLDNPSTCPHGRPVMWKLRKNKLEENFRRNL